MGCWVRRGQLCHEESAGFEVGVVSEAVCAAAQALLEGIQYDDDGNLLTGNFMDYLVISAAIDFLRLSNRRRGFV